MTSTLTEAQPLTHEVLLECDPRAERICNTGDPDARLCGRGIAQQGWPACHRPGVWRVWRSPRVAYDYTYCTPHAVRRLQLLDAFDAMARRAADERARLTGRTTT